MINRVRFYRNIICVFCAFLWLNMLSQFVGDEWNYAPRHVNGRFDVTRVCEVPGNVYPTHVGLESFRIVNGNFREFSGNL